MRISDWSSDVCSSDLTILEIGIAVTEATTIAEEIAVEIAVVAVLDAADFAVALTRRHIAADRTARADARRILHVPLARVALGMGLVGEHAGRTDLGDRKSTRLNSSH